MPIILPSGAFFGTLCAIDPRPARLNTPEVVGMFKNFAQLIAFYLDAQERAAKQDAALLDAQEAAKLREQFVAILAHDLRNPLASIDAGVGLILRTQPDEKTRSVAERIRNSVKRMVSLIDDTLDFAKARLGAGSNWSVTPVRRLSFQQTEYVVRQRRQDLRRRFQFPPRRRAGNALHKGAKTCMDLLPAGRPLPRPTCRNALLDRCSNHFRDVATAERDPLLGKFDRPRLRFDLLRQALELLRPGGERREVKAEGKGDLPPFRA
jgi:signal transduction histidine kinase